MSARESADMIQRIETVREGLNGVARASKLLSSIAWTNETERDFFARGADSLPKVTYAIDRDAAQGRIEALTKVEHHIEGDDTLASWLRGTVHSFIDGNRLLLSVGTDEFYRLSRSLYGSAKTRFLDDTVRNIDLANHLLDRLDARSGDEAHDRPAKCLSDVEFADALRARVDERLPKLELEIAIDDTCTSKVIAGRSKVRVRRGASFLPWEVDSLWRHEIETHALTANNGAAQESAPFLCSGGPRATLTQEGLAVFSELYHRGFSMDRVDRLATRVKLVDMAEDGASFLDLYRYLVGRGASSHDAYLDAQRVCRGGRIEGGAPFTKDVCYLSGLVHVYSFLSVVVRAGLRDEAEMLVCGRIAIEDMPTFALLRNRKVLTRPKFLPTWLKDWRALVPYFGFASFFNRIELPRVEQHYRKILQIAEREGP